jgi:ElaB/YqjD/DUF883 family membrane-anchored ribosome-binding protein
MVQKRSIGNRIEKKAIELYDTARDKALDVKDETEDLIVKHPFMSVAIAAAVGAAVALGVNALIQRREKSFMDRFSNWF